MVRDPLSNLQAPGDSSCKVGRRRVVSSQGESSEVVIDFHLPHDMSSYMVAPLRTNIVAPMRLHAYHLRWEFSELANGRTMVDWMTARPPLTKFWVGLLPRRRAVALMKPRSLRTYELTGLLIHCICVFLFKNEINPPD